MNDRATHNSWKNYPIDIPERIKTEMQFSEEQFLKLVKGFIPQQMEDKWFIRYEEGWLYFYRSWTGYGIYKAKLEKVPDGYVVKEFWVERNKEKYKNENDRSDKHNFSSLIARLLLNTNLSDIYNEPQEKRPK